MQCLGVIFRLRVFLILMLCDYGTRMCWNRANRVFRINDVKFGMDVMEVESP